MKKIDEILFGTGAGKVTKVIAIIAGIYVATIAILSICMS